MAYRRRQTVRSGWWDRSSLLNTVTWCPFETVFRLTHLPSAFVIMAFAVMGGGLFVGKVLHGAVCNILSTLQYHEYLQIYTTYVLRMCKLSLCALERRARFPTPSHTKPYNIIIQARHHAHSWGRGSMYVGRTFLKAYRSFSGPTYLILELERLCSKIGLLRPPILLKRSHRLAEFDDALFSGLQGCCRCLESST